MIKTGQVVKAGAITTVKNKKKYWPFCRNQVTLAVEKADAEAAGDLVPNFDLNKTKRSFSRN